MGLYEDQNGRKINFDSYYDPPSTDDEEEENGPEVMDSILADAERIEMEIDSFPKICGDCKGKNLIEYVHLVVCERCKESYCVHFASSVDPQYCEECCNRVEMTEETIHKTTEHYNEDKKKFYTRSQKARQIKFSGEDWLFVSRRFSTLNDTERLLDIEYHQACLSQLLYDRERARQARFHRNAGKPTPAAPLMPDGTVKVETKVKRTRTVSADKTARSLQTLMGILAAMKAQGKTDEEIIKLLGKK